MTGLIAEQRQTFPQLENPSKVLPPVDTHLFVHSEAEWKALRDSVEFEPYASEIINLRNSLEAGMGSFDWETAVPASPDPKMHQLRAVGDMIAALAFLNKIEERAEDREALIKVIRYVLDQPAWGIHPRGPNVDLAAGHIMFGLALAYDWCGNALPAELKYSMADTLLERGGQMADFVRVPVEPLNARRNYQNNHSSCRLLALTAVGVVLYGQDPRAEEMITKALGLGRTTFEIMANGDSFIGAEGTPYWQYGLSFLVPMAVIVKENLNIDLFTDNRGFQQVPLVQAYLMLPQGVQRSQRYSSGLIRPSQDLLNFGDGPQHTWYDYNMYMTYLAKVYNDGLAQWLAQDYRQSYSGHNPLTRFLGLIWLEPDVEPTPPSALPREHWFSEQGLFVWRSGWNGSETVLALRCTAPGGEYATLNFNRNTGTTHSQPDAGTFLAFANNSWLISPPGYTLNRQTAYANTILIDGQGQIGSGDKWMHTDIYAREQRLPTITDVSREGDITRVTCDLTPAYQIENLVQCQRTFILVDENCWLVIDEVKLTESASAEAIFHGGKAFEVSDFKTAVMPLEDATLEATLVGANSTDLMLSAEVQEIPVKKKERAQPTPILRVQAGPGTQLRWATLFQIRKPGPYSGWQLKIDTSADTLRLVGEGRVLSLPWNPRETASSTE